MQKYKDRGKEFRRKAQSRCGIRSCTKCLRKVLLVTMCLVVIMGLILIVSGAVVYQTLLGISALRITSIQSLPLGIVIIGILTFLSTFLGFCGACCKSEIFLVLNFVMLSILFICELGVGGAAYTYSSGIKEKLREQWITSPDDVRDVIQQDYYCCGFNSTTDYPAGANCTDLPDNGVLEPCGNLLASQWIDDLVAIGLIGVLVGIFQFLVLVLSLFMFCCLCCDDDDSEDQVRMTERETTDRSRFDRDRVLNKFKPRWCTLF